MGKMAGSVIILALLVPLLAVGCLNTVSDAREWNTKGETDHVMGYLPVMAFEKNK